MTGFDAAVAGFAASDEAAPGRPWRFREKPMDVRHALDRRRKRWLGTGSRGR